MIPQPLLSVLDSLDLSGLPGSATPGDRIDLRITPDISPPAGGGLPPVLADLTRTDALATVDLDPSALVQWLIDAIGVKGWSKQVEFEQPVGATPAELEADAAVKRALAHLIPKGTGVSLEQSTVVEGAIGRLELTKDAAEGAVKHVVGTINRAGLLGTISQPTVAVRLRDETGTPMAPGTGFFMSGGAAPSLVFLPVVVASRAAQPTIRRTVEVEVSLSYTPPAVPGAPAPAPIPIPRTLGPFPIDLATVELPMVALLARHPLHDAGSNPGHVFVGVPDGSSMTDLGDVIEAIQTLQTVLGNVRTVLAALGIGLPGAIAETLRVLEFVPTVAGDFRFRKGDLIGLWELFHDWQYIMSAAMVIGPPTRRAFFGGMVEGSPVGFSLRPSPIGVGFVPDLGVDPIESAAVAGTAVEDWPLPEGANFDNKLTSVNFPAV